MQHLSLKSTQQSASKITLISLVALVLAHTMINTFFPSVILNILGLLITSFYIYYQTLRKDNLFAYVMVMYFCSFFPYLAAKGGGFNLVSFIVFILYLIEKWKTPSEIKFRDKWTNFLILLLIVSSILGWSTNYTGTGIELSYSIISFFGIIFLLILSSRLNLTNQNIKIFLQLNIVIIIYSTIVSANKFFKIINIDSPMMSKYGFDIQTLGYIEAGGLVNSSPNYGEYSMILLLLFFVFYLFQKRVIGLNRKTLFSFAILSFINVFLSISRSVFLLSLVGLIAVYLLQFKINQVNIIKQLSQIVTIIVFGLLVIFSVEKSKLDFVLKRVAASEEQNKSAGGITTATILNGSAFNRSTAFDEGYKRYDSKQSWLIGYGLGIGDNNRDAYYVDPTIKRGSAHSQIFAVLFILGWIGLISYFGLYFRAIYNSYQFISNKRTDYNNRVMAFFFFIGLGAFLINEIKVDSISFPYYFTVTIIWLGMAFANINTAKAKMRAEIYKIGK